MLSDEDDSDLEFEIGNISDTEDFIEKLNESEIENVKSEEEEDSITPPSSNNFRSKCGYIWSLIPPTSSKRRQCNILSENSGLRNESLNVTSIKEMFSLFITDEMIKEICEETNRHILRIQTTEKRIGLVTEKELHAFIGVLLASRRNKKRKLGLNNLWTIEGPFRQPFFTAAISRDRFIAIYSFISFDDRETRQTRFESSLNKLEPIESIFSKFVEACKRYYSPASNITVDERLTIYMGNCPFRTFVKGKPGRYGIKIWVAADSLNAYILNLRVYTGMNNNTREVNQGNQVVLDLVHPYFGTNRGVTTDKFFTSVLLADDLLSNGLTLTGILRKNKREIPKKLLSSKLRLQYSSMFAFASNKTLVSYAPQDKKTVLLLSTQFQDNKLSETDQKPQIIKHYNSTKDAVDTGYKMTKEYSCVRSTKRWPFRLFMEILDIAAFNSYLLWIEKYPEWKSNDKSRRKTYIRQLGVELAKPNILIRKSSTVKFHKAQQDAIDSVLSYCHEISPDSATDEVIVNNSHESSSTKSRLTCRFCPYQTKKRSTIFCSACEKPICKEHRIETKKFKCLDCINLI